MKPLGGTRVARSTSTAASKKSAAPKLTSGGKSGGAFAGTSSLVAERPSGGTSRGAAVMLRVSAGGSVTTLAQHLAALVPPRRDLTVLELGPRGSTEAYARARGQVTAFVDGADDAAALDAKAAYHHVEVRGGAELGALGVNAGRFNLVVARAVDVAHAGDAARLTASLAPGGSLVVQTSGKRLPRALVAAAEADGLVLGKPVRIDGGFTFALKKPGARPPLPVDRTACVDRARVAALIDAPLVEGPARMTVVDDADPTLRRQLDTLIDGLAAGALDPADLVFPDRVAASAVEGAPGVDCLVVFAHPDDESGYAAGALAGITAQGKRVHYAVATDGGGGLGGSGADLAATRLHELDGAAQALGIGAISVLGLDDAGMYTDDHRAVPVTAADALALWGVDAALEKLVRAIREQRPRAILGFDPTRDPDWGLHGHHLAMGLATAVAVHLAADPRAFPEQGLAPWSVAEQWAVVPPGSRGGRQVTVDVDAAKKRAALAAHHTQSFSLDGKLAQPGGTERWHLFQARVAPTLF